MVKKLWVGNNEVMDVMSQKFTELSTETQVQMAMMVRMEAMVQEVFAELETVKNSVMDIANNVVDLKDTNHIGKKPVFLKPIQDEVAKLTPAEIRSMIHGAARRQPTGYNAIYLKVREMTGVDVFHVGKIAITKSDGLGFVNKAETYINAIFKKGVEQDAAAIALDIIRNK